MAAGLEQAAATQGEKCGAANRKPPAEISGGKPEVIVHGAAELAEAIRSGYGPSELPIPETNTAEPGINEQRIPAVVVTWTPASGPG